MHHSELRIACAWKRPPSALIPLQTLIACLSPFEGRERLAEAFAGEILDLTPACLRPWVWALLLVVERVHDDLLGLEGDDEALEDHVVASLLSRYGCFGSQR